MWNAALSLVTVSHVISLSSAIGMAQLVRRELLVACLGGITAAPGIARGDGVLPNPSICGDSRQQPTEPSLKHSISSILATCVRLALLSNNSHDGGLYLYMML